MRSTSSDIAQYTVDDKPDTRSKTRSDRSTIGSHRSQATLKRLPWLDGKSSLSSSPARTSPANRPGTEPASTFLNNTKPPLNVTTTMPNSPVLRKASAKSAPIQSAPIQSAPIQSAPIQSAPIQSAPIQSAPIQSAPIQSAPIQSAPIQSAPTQSAPIQSAPTQSAPTQSPPVQSAPIQSAPIQSAPIQSAPIQSAPIQSAPIQSAPTHSLTQRPEIVPIPQPSPTIPSTQRHFHSADDGLRPQPEPTPDRPVSLARSAPSLYEDATLHRVRIATYDPVKKFYIVHTKKPGGTLGKGTRELDDLAPVPSHLQQDEMPALTLEPLQQESYRESTPHVTIAANVFTSHPIPQSNSVYTAIEGLEDVAGEAVIMADAVDRTVRVQEVGEVVDDTKKSAEECSYDSTRELLFVPPQFNVVDSTEDLISFTPKLHMESAFQNTPVHPNHTLLVTPEQRNVVEIMDASAPSSSLLEITNKSKTIDWAYRRTSDDGIQSESSASRHGDFSDPYHDPLDESSILLLQPEPVQSGARDHVDFLVRATNPGDDSHRNSRYREALSPQRSVRRRRHHRGWRSSGRSSDHHSDRSRSDLAFDEEDTDATGRPLGIKQYGYDLRLRDQANHHTFSIHREYRRQPIARNWTTKKKRITASICCVNTSLMGIIVGIYAGEVPRIQYMLADENHHVILGNVTLYLGLALSTFIAWPLPLLHGRKPYILASLVLAMPLQFPQALVVGEKRSPLNPSFTVGLLVSRLFSGLVLGFANVNFVAIMFDLFGASLQSNNMHQEITVASDVRRHGGGMGIWLGIWSWCLIGSLAVGFLIGASIITYLTPDWGFYIVIMILALVLVLNVIAPETRRSAHRRSVTEVYDRDENFITRRVAKGEIKLHICTEGPKYWFEEVWAGIKLQIMMLCQPGFFALSFYLAWIYAQIVLVIVLLGALLSRSYSWKPQFVGLGVLTIAVGALLAVPLTKAGIFSRDRKQPFRTDSMTFRKEITWTNHFVRRCIFTFALPLMGLAYTLSSTGKPRPVIVPIIFAGAVGFLSTLAIAECHGIIMEVFDTSDLQPGVNTKHRLQSMAVQDRRRRTNYSSFPRVSAGIFATQTLSFILAAIATEVGGVMTRHIGAQASTGVTAGILLFLTLLIALVLVRFRDVQVIPNHTFGTKRDSAAWREFADLEKAGRGQDWRAVVIGNPSGKMRRMNVLELGGLSRWTEIRKLNFLIKGVDRGKKKEEWYQGGVW